MGRLYKELETTVENDRGQFVKLNLGETIATVVACLNANRSDYRLYGLRRPGRQGSLDFEEVSRSLRRHRPQAWISWKLKKNLTARQLFETQKYSAVLFLSQKMDDMGLAMETFDAVGAGRKEGARCVRSFPDGSKFKDFNDIRRS